MELENVVEIAGASTRLDVLHFGTVDYATLTDMHTTNIDRLDLHYAVLTDSSLEDARDYHWQDLRHYPMMHT